MLFISSFYSLMHFPSPCFSTFRNPANHVRLNSSYLFVLLWPLQSLIYICIPSRYPLLSLSAFSNLSSSLLQPSFLLTLALLHGKFSIPMCLSTNWYMFQDQLPFSLCVLHACCLLHNDLPSRFSLFSCRPLLSVTSFSPIFVLFLGKFSVPLCISSNLFIFQDQNHLQPLSPYFGLPPSLWN